ncbi:methyltransferase family protein [Mycolicibacterium chubuense NBB4]|uniref:Methyltransferase family protein n=1 Tax=Mycolicibacterium chubuense (strain NBB4) TaxID=710421 RepID=I4BRJ5_MYCCN|nr:methyltransferase domain-containing protein [Mycolicibacterium chubuense]AFM19902.1 methyltransferase family protein [Mycolicibacterium chubuense NBB4]
MTDAMNAEFDTVAEWTAEAARELGPDYYVPAGCRGSGSPAALDWLIDELELTAGESLLDSGGGVGGPAAYAAQAVGVTPVLVEPEAGACRAARRLFDFPVVRALGSALPIADAAVDAAWSLGVLCTTPDQLGLLTELRRTVRAPGRIALLVFAAREPVPADEQPEGNNFPTIGGLEALVQDAGLRVRAWRSTADLPAIPDEWTRRIDAVTDAMEQRHGSSQTWRLAQHQSEQIGDLLAAGKVTGEMLILAHA